MFSMTRQAETQFFRACERIRHGRLRVRTPDGRTREFGDTGPEAEFVVRDWRLMGRIATRGDIGFGESYVDGQWDSPCIETLAQVATMNRSEFGGLDRPNWASRLMLRLSDALLRANSLSGSSRNIRAHYDVGNEFYQLWLDPTMTYSSAIFGDEAGPLEQAQHAKNDRILSRIGETGSLLEIGCGWGGFAERAADAGHRVTGITLSPSQKGYADARLDGRAEIALRDYRRQEGKFDNIVSIEMIEAVGRRYWPTYFATLRERLAGNGRAVVQAILVGDAYFDTYASTSDYVRRHVFPGGFLPSDGKIREQAMAANLVVADAYHFGPSYAETCRRWARNLDAAKERVLKLGYDETFVRAWHYYLAVCTASFATGRSDVAQYEFHHA